jgi:hypothetical protein
LEKILQILAVFVLLALVIHRMIKGRESQYQPYNYLTRLRAPLAAEVGQRLVTALFEAETADAVLADEVRQLVFSYHATGSLTIYWREKEMQWLAAPLNCTGMALDPMDGRLYLEAEGSFFVYGF